MSANVWFREVYIGLLQELQNSVKVHNKRGEKVSLPDKAFSVRKPEEDFKFETFPCVSIYVKDYEHDPVRYYPQAVKISDNVETAKILVEEPAVSFNLDVQIDFWSRYQEDMDDMTMTWLMSHFRQFNLNVVDDGGTERSCNVNKVGSIVKSDLVLEKERLFHTIINYVIWVELDDEIQYNKPMVVTTNLGATPIAKEE